MNRTHFDAVVVGGGLVGSSAALMLALRGRRVALFDRHLCGAQASGVNFGGVRSQGRPMEQLPLAVRARAIWRRLKDLIGTDGEFVASGHFRLARSKSDLEGLAHWGGMAKDFGISTRLYTGRDFRQQYPWVGPAACGGSLCVGDGHANPRLVSPAFARAAEEAGALVRNKTEVSGLRHDGDVFRMRAGTEAEITSDWLVNAAGAWANKVAESFGDGVPMKAIYPNMWVTEPLPVFMTHSLGVFGGGFYARQVQRGNCIIGGGRGSGDGSFAQPSNVVTLNGMRGALDMLPALRDALVIRTWSGVEGQTPDSNPVIGLSPTTPRLLHAFGFSGGGFQLAPGVGELLAELIVDGRTDTPIEAFSPARFSQPASAHNP